MQTREIRLAGVRQNNLKNLTVTIPHRKITVVTGLSGSGKSSLAFDTLYAEGQRRYVESLSTYSRQFLEKMPKPEVDEVAHIPPSIALEQKNGILNSRSSVGTQTEILDYLRVLYARIGATRCMDCGGPVEKLDAARFLEWALRWLPGRRALILAPAPAPGGSKAPKKTKNLVVAWLRSFREQGYRRIFWKSDRKKQPGGVLDLDELETPDFPEIPAHAAADGEIFLVVDRLAGGDVHEPETRTRIADSIDQALAVGRGRIVFADLSAMDKNAADAWKPYERTFACADCGRAHRLPDPNLFSFNSPIGACARCSGFGHTLEIDEALVVPDPSKTIKNGAIDPLSKPSMSDWEKELFRFCERHGISVGKRYRELTPAQRKLIWDGDPTEQATTRKRSTGFPGILGCFEELKRWKYKLHVRVFIRRYQTQSLCPACQGARLQPEALAVKIGGRSIAEVQQIAVVDLLHWFQSLELSPSQRKIAGEALYQVERRLQFLEEVGVGYLTLARLARTLSGGEFQRINLATQLGNGLCGTLYVLDEPSIGLHAADTERLIRILERLRDQGNTVVVVEHDLAVMKAADHLIELGPGAGRRGGEIVAQGTSESLSLSPASVTGRYLTGSTTVAAGLAFKGPRPPAKKILRLTGCRENNLKNLALDIPLERLVVVTGVSGSGKSTLVHKTLHHALAKLFHNATETPGHFDKLYGAEQISGVALLDQSSIGRSSRSNPATYLKAWDEIRRLYATQTLALRRGYSPLHFSFNVDGGRCPVCKGEGEITLDMHFMAELRLPCDECGGKRFKKPVLDVTYRGKNVDQLLHTTIDDTYEIFRDHPILSRKLGVLRDVGLGYLHLGQPAGTLSGGESQRLKIAATLDERTLESLLYIFDEPTTGLHLEDVKRLITVVQDLVIDRHSVVLIEHHLDVIAAADWVVDLGPAGGDRGGHLTAVGTPEEIARNPDSVTGRMLVAAGYFSGVKPERTLEL